MELANEERMPTPTSSSILHSAEGAAVYDRQIRLWGMETQKRISESRILFVGLSGTSAEVCKNLVLGGVGAVTLMDDAVVKEADLRVNFFLTPSDVGKNRARAALDRLSELNPYVKFEVVEISPSKLCAKTVKDHTIVCAASASTSLLAQLNDVCRHGGVPFVGIGSAGFSAFAFMDLLEHQYTETTVKDGKEEKPEEKTMKYVSLGASLATSWTELPRKPHRLFFALKARHESRDERDAAACCKAMGKALQEIGQGGDVSGETAKKRKRNNKVPAELEDDYLRCMTHTASLADTRVTWTKQGCCRAGEHRGVCSVCSNGGRRGTTGDPCCVKKECTAAQLAPL